MYDIASITGIRDAIINCIDQAQPLVHLLE
jgi:hypothetical protein